MNSDVLDEDAWDDLKSKCMEQSLGSRRDNVLHAIVSDPMGGGLDLYYHNFPRGGTAIATMELSQSSTDGPTNATFRTYELAMATRYAFSVNTSGSSETDFERAREKISETLSVLAPYCYETKVEQFDTCEFPEDMELVGGCCLIFDAICGDEKDSGFGVMIPIEIHRSELAFARDRGGQELIRLLKVAQVYPYSTLDRPPVA